MLLALSDEPCLAVADFLHVVEATDRWLAAASCIMFFLLPNMVDSERLVALLASQIRRWKWTRAELMEDIGGMYQRRKQRSGAHSEADAGLNNPGAVTLLIELQRAFFTKRLFVGWSWWFFVEVPVFQLRTLCTLFAHRRSIIFAGIAAAPVQCLHGTVARKQIQCGTATAGDASTMA